MSSNSQQTPTATYELPEELLSRAMWFICNERHVYHRYCVLQDSPAFLLFFMDRCYDWQFEATEEAPIISRYNGFMEIVCRESFAERSFDADQLLGVLRRAARDDAHIALPMSFVHEDGTPYVSPWLIESIDDGDVVYYTQTGTGSNAFRKPVPFTEVFPRVALDEDGLVQVTEVRPSPTIERILNAGPLEVFRQVFAEYGLRWYDGRLHRYVTPVVVGVSAFDTLIADWQERAEGILAAGTVMFFDQLRLNKHIQNRFQPTQLTLRYIFEEPAISGAIGAGLELRARNTWTEMDRALSDLFKYSSLLVQKPNRQSMDLYLKHLRQLRDVVAEYQQVILAVQLAVTG